MLRLRLSSYWQWYGLDRLESIRVELPFPEAGQLRHIRLVNGAGISPALDVPGAALDRAGEYPVHNELPTVDIDCTMVPGARYAEVDLYKPDYFVDHYPEGVPDDAVWTRRMEHGQRARVNVQPGALRAPGRAQARGRCLDGQRSPIGEYSEVISFRFE